MQVTVFLNVGHAGVQGRSQEFILGAFSPSPFLLSIPPDFPSSFPRFRSLSF